MKKLFIFFGAMLIWTIGIYIIVYFFDLLSPEFIKWAVLIIGILLFVYISMAIEEDEKEKIIKSITKRNK